MSGGLDQDVAHALVRAERVDRDLTKLLNGLDLIGTDRLRLAAGALMIALDIHTSIAQLVRARLYPTAFILCRSLWEATVRGYWLFNCATDEQLARFVDDKLDYKIACMINALEQSGAFEVNALTEIHRHNWARLNAMTHVGGPLVVRCNSSDGVQHNFDNAEIVECLGYATAIALLAATGVAEVSNNIAIGTAIATLNLEAFA